DSALGRLISSFRLAGAADARSSTITVPERIRLVFQDLGPTFIKLGQILSTRPDLVSDEVMTELQRLQDNVPPFAFREAQNLIESELGKTIADAYASFEETPLGTASIGQVYAARLPSGADVVVKVQRPGVRDLIESDTDLMLMTARQLERRLPALRVLDPVGIVEQFRRAVRRELDYTNEMRNARRFGTAFQENPRIVVPAVFPDHSTRLVFTMQRIRGVRITEAGSLGIDPRELAGVAVESVLAMVFEHGFFHADPHPGNIFALEGGKIAFLDLGMVGRLDEGLRFRLVDLIVALVENDVDAASRALLAMGVHDGPIDRALFTADVSEIMEKIVGVPISEVCLSELIQDLFNGTRRHKIRIPPDCYLMGKALLTVESVARTLNPDLDIGAAVTPHLKRLLVMRHAPVRIGRLLWRRLGDAADAMGDLPGQVSEILDSMQHGRLTLRVETAEQGRTMMQIERLIGKMIAALILASLVLSSAMFITFSKLDYTIMGVPAQLFLGIAGYLVAALLGLYVIRNVVRKADGDG
ncbi:MAG TPA: AarF/ABC1/UbiB kinase family protein, partial [Candidatus Ozemobacteraceae bacterium]|nr:AarF/ABC1/UbiB kinase family protein [Candidatus Ozemobacteraceae bacterium]